MNNLLPLIIKREFMARVRNRTFRVMTFLSPLLMVGMVSVIIGLRTLQKDQKTTIAYLDETHVLDDAFTNTTQIQFRNYNTFTLQKAKELVTLEGLYALLYIPKESANPNSDTPIQFFTAATPDPIIIEAINNDIKAKFTKLNLSAIGIDPQKIEAQEAEITIAIQTFSGGVASETSDYVKMFFGGAAGYLLMMFIIIYGNMVMRSVIEEKTNRIIEIIISSVHPIQLMFGKIVGTSFAGITQFLIWLLFGGLLFQSVQWYFGLETTESLRYLSKDYEMLFTVFQDIENLPLATYSIFFLLYFISGYFLYSSIYAAIGAAVDSETDAQQFRFPIMIPLMLAIYVGFFTVLQDPHSTVATIFSMVPLTSPVVMLMRIPFGVPWWEILISMLILLGSIAFTVWIAAKIYKVGILMYGKKPTYKDLFTWLKY